MRQVGRVETATEYVALRALRATSEGMRQVGRVETALAGVLWDDHSLSEGMRQAGRLVAGSSMVVFS